MAITTFRKSIEMSHGNLDTSHWPSVNALTNPLVRHLLENAKNLRIGVERLANGCTIVDAGIQHPGGL